MLNAQRGFTLLETLIAMALGCVVLLGAGRVLPALQREIMLEYQYVAQHEALWQMALTIGKYLRRAGYCRGVCRGKGLRITDNGSCVVVQWDANGNGRWDTGADSQSEQIGYRLRGGNLETQKGVLSCEGSGWEKLSDPELMVVQHFSVTRRERQSGQPLLSIRLVASLKGSARTSAVTYIVSGENL